jgi:hypothetical protein
MKQIFSILKSSYKKKSLFFETTPFEQSECGLFETVELANLYLDTEQSILNDIPLVKETINRTQSIGSPGVLEYVCSNGEILISFRIYERSVVTEYKEVKEKFRH